jgi:hypothetical protein
MLEWLAKHSFFYFLDGYSGYHQILMTKAKLLLLVPTELMIIVECPWIMQHSSFIPKVHDVYSF